MEGHIVVPIKLFWALIIALLVNYEAVDDHHVVILTAGDSSFPFYPSHFNFSSHEKAADMSSMNVWHQKKTSAKKVR